MSRITERMSPDDGLAVDEPDLAEAFRRDVEPQIAALETYRRRRLTKTWVFVGPTLGISVITAVLALTLPDLQNETINNWLYTGFFVGPAVAFLIYAFFSKGFVGRVKDAVMPRRAGLFEVGGLRRPLANLESEMDRLLYEVTIPHRVIDQLIGDDTV